jgi:hypothetical protein
LLLKKKSGKTSTIFKILQKYSNKNTKLIIFSSTVYKDNNWILIIKYFAEKNMHIETYTSIFDEDSKNLIQNLINILNLEKQPKEKKLKQNSIIFENKEEKEKKKKPKKIGLKYIFVFDNLSGKLQNKYISVLLK